MDKYQSQRYVLYTTELETITRMKKLAKKEHRSFSNLMLLAVMEYLDKHAPLKPKDKKHK